MHYEGQQNIPCTLAVATWPSVSTRSMVPVGKYGRINLNDLARYLLIREKYLNVGAYYMSYMHVMKKKKRVILKMMMKRVAVMATMSQYEDYNNDNRVNKFFDDDDDDDDNNGDGDNDNGDGGGGGDAMTTTPTMTAMMTKAKTPTIKMTKMMMVMIIIMMKIMTKRRQCLS